MKKNRILMFSLIVILLFSSLPIQADDDSYDAFLNNYNFLLEMSKKQIDVTESVVLIKTYDENGEVISYGSGVVISDNGLIVTNYYNLEGGSYFGIVFKGMEEGYEYLTANVFGVSIENNLAILKANVPTQPLQVVPYSELKQGQEVIAVGATLDFENMTTSGFISAIVDTEGVELIHTTIPVSSGSLGGALLDVDNNLIGITTLIILDDQVLNCAISSKHIIELLEDENTQLNMDLYYKNGIFEYGNSYIIFDTSNFYDNNNKYIINFLLNYEIKADFNIFIQDAEFKKQFEEFYIDKVKETVKKYGISTYQFNLFTGDSIFTYECQNGKIKNKKWINEQDDAQNKSKEKTLRINLGNEVYSLDPLTSISFDEYQIIRNMFEGLMIEKNGKVELGMAKKYTVSEDNKTYTFHLRDAKWSDGKAVKASDFEYAWKRMLDPENYGYAVNLFCIEGAQAYYEGNGSIEDVKIKAINDKTLEVTLNKPIPYFLKLVSTQEFFPLRKDIIEQSSYDWAENPATSISNGPFKLEEFVEGTKVVLTKNDNYYNKKATKLDKVNFYMFEDENIALSGYKEGTFDIVEDVSLENTSNIKNKDKVVNEFFDMDTWYFRLNPSKAPLDNVKVRRAISLAIDRKSIVNSILNHKFKPATGIVPPGIYTSEGKDFREEAGDYGIIVDKARVDEAKKLLAEAGYPNGENFPEISILSNDSEMNIKICEMVKDMLENTLNIKVNLENTDFLTTIDREYEGDYTIIFMGWLGDYSDPMTFLEEMTYKTTNAQSGWSSHQYTELLQKSYNANGKERDEMLFEAEKILIEESVVIPLYYGTHYVIVNPEIKNLERTGQGYWYLGNTSIK